MYGGLPTVPPPHEESSCLEGFGERQVGSRGDGGPGSDIPHRDQKHVYEGEEGEGEIFLGSYGVWAALGRGHTSVGDEWKLFHYHKNEAAL